jgi:hypothetical protein
MTKLKFEIEEKLANLDSERLPYSKTDVIQLIISIEKYKRRFLEGDLSANELIREVRAKLDRFKTQHSGFDFLTDSALNAYYSKESA